MSAQSILQSSGSRWLLLTLLPRFGLKVRERILAHTESLTDILEMNVATLKAMGLTDDAVAAVVAWQAGHTEHPVLRQALAIQAACEDHGIVLVGLGGCLSGGTQTHS